MVEHKVSHTETTWAEVVKEDVPTTEKHRLHKTGHHQLHHETFHHQKSQEQQQKQQPQQVDKQQQLTKETSAGAKTTTGAKTAVDEGEDVSIVRDRPVLEEVHTQRTIERREKPIVEEYREQPVIEVREHPQQKRIVHDTQRIVSREPTVYEERGNEKDVKDARKMVQEELRGHSARHTREADQVHTVQEEPEVHVHTRRKIEVHDRPIIYERHEQPVEEIVEKPVVRVVHEKPIVRVVRDEEVTQLPDYLPHEKHLPRKAAADLAPQSTRSSEISRSKRLGAKAGSVVRDAVGGGVRGVEQALETTASAIDRGVQMGENVLERAEGLLERTAEAAEEGMESLENEMAYEYEHGIRWFDPRLWAFAGFFGSLMLAHALGSNYGKY